MSPGKQCKTVLQGALDGGGPKNVQREKRNQTDKVNGMDWLYHAELGYFCSTDLSESLNLLRLSSLSPRQCRSFVKRLMNK